MNSIIGALAAAALTIGYGVIISPSALLVGLPIIAALFLGVFLIQWLGFAVAWLLRTERYYDLTGSLTYITVVGLAWFMAGDPAPGAELLFIAVSLWAVRLGSFLFLRVIEVGEDQRFRHIKVSAPRFFMAWTLQGMWVSFTVSAVLVALLPGNAASDFLPAGLSRAVFVAGCCLAMAGLIIEVIADHQKARFRKNPDNKGQFIQTGLWSRCRHPNYFGEIVFWFGLALAASPAMSGAQHLAWFSPLFVYLLLTRLSGIPTLVKRGQQLWGDEPEYQAYLARTPRLVPRVMGARGGSAL
jgi:steroid 5-alpha reductase family enzyme